MAGENMPHERRDFYVYALLREDGSPFYIGKGTRKRWRHHLGGWSIGQNPHKDAIIRLIRAAGADPGVIFIQRGMSETEALAVERAEISRLGRQCDGGILCNLLAGGISTANPPPEVRARISAALQGRKHSEATRARLSEARRKRVTTPETKAKMSASQKVRLANPEALARHAAGSRGRKFSAEALAKRSAAQAPIRASEDFRARLRAAAQKRSSDPAYRAKMSVAQSARRERERAATESAKKGAHSGTCGKDIAASDPARGTARDTTYAEAFSAACS